MRTQGGMQPIHCAAIYGQIGVISILVERYGVDPQEKADVRMYIQPCIHLDIIKISRFKKGVGMTIKGKETSSKLCSYPAMEFLTTHSTSRTGYYLCLFIQTQFQLVSYVVTSMDAQMKHNL